MEASQPHADAGIWGDHMSETQTDPEPLPELLGQDTEAGPDSGNGKGRPVEDDES